MAIRKSSKDGYIRYGSDEDSTNLEIARAQKSDGKIKGQRSATHKFKKLSPLISPSSKPELVQRASGSKISITTVSTTPPSRVLLTEEYRAVAQRGQDYDTLNNMYQGLDTLPPGQVYIEPQTVLVDSHLDQIQQTKQTKQQCRYKQPLQHHVESDHSPQNLLSQMEQLVLELPKVELERNSYKYEVEQKQQHQEYENQIVPYTFYGQCSTVDYSRMKEMEDSLTKQKNDLVTKKDAKIEQLEDQLDNKKAEMEKEKSAMKHSKDTKERELKQHMAKLQNDLDQAKATKSVAEAQLKSTRKQYDEQRQQFQQIHEEFRRTKKCLKLKEESNQKREEVKSKLKTEITTLEQTLEKNKEELSISQAKARRLQLQLAKKFEEHSNLQNDLVREKERIRRLEKAVHSIKEENQLNVLRTTTRIDAVEEEHKKFTTARDDKTQLAADQGQKILQLEQQLKEARNLVEQLMQENAELETKLQVQQTQFVEDGARATPNTSLTDEEKLKVCLEQLKEKDEEIVDLNGQISTLKEEKRSFKEEIAMLKARGSIEDIPHDVILAQIEELTKERQEILQEREELDIKVAQHDHLVNEIKALKEKLLHCETYSQIDTSVSTGSQSISHDGRKLSDKNEIEHIKRKYKNLEGHNTKLKMQLHQKEDDVEKQSKILSELKMQLQQKDEETKLISELNEQVKHEVIDAATEIQTLKEEIENLKKEIEAKEMENERKSKCIGYHLEHVSQKAKEVKKLQEEILQKEIERQNAIEVAKEKQEQITALQETLNTEAEQTAVFEQKWKAVVLEMENDCAVVNDKLTNELELAQAKVLELEGKVSQLTTEQHELDRTKDELKRTKAELDDTKSTLEATKQQAAIFKDDFKQERADRERNCIHLTNEIIKYQGIAKTLEEKLTQSSHELAQVSQNSEALCTQHATEKLALQEKLEEEKNTLQAEKHLLEDSLKDWEEEKMILTSQVKAYSRQCEELKKTMVQLQEKSKNLEEQLYHKERIASEDLQLLHEENKRKSKTIDYYLNLLKSKNDELQEVKATQDQFQQNILHIQQIQQKTEQARQDLQEQCHQQQQEYQEAVHIHKQQIDQLCNQLNWVVDEEEVTMTQDVLGRGSYGEVKVAFFRGLRVAAKFLHDVIISDFNRGIFIREMDIASKVRHPNLVQFFGAIRGDATIILTEIMPTSLYKELQKKAMTRSQILGISRDVASALNYLHLWKPNPIIHRDISTPNVLLEPSVGDCFKAKVSDYGAANLQQDAMTDMPGNAAYAAPESRYPDDHTPAMDVYSYSVLLIVMILHCPPAMTVIEREEQAKRVSWPSMSSLIHRCLNRDRHRRPTMTQILDLLLNV